MSLTPAIAEYDAQPLRDRVVLITGGAQASDAASRRPCSARAAS
ncbi:hypothetical protein DYST_00184 [Dyella terrae]|nr:hypothetical protein DYST_00184 [Dyella terrae]